LRLRYKRPTRHKTGHFEDVLLSQSFRPVSVLMLRIRNKSGIRRWLSELHKQPPALITQWETNECILYAEKQQRSDRKQHFSPTAVVEVACWTSETVAWLSLTYLQFPIYVCFSAIPTVFELSFSSFNR